MAAVEAGVDVSGARDFKLLEAGDLSHRRNDLFRDLSGRLAQLFCQLKTERQSVFTQLNVGRLVDDDARQFRVIEPLQQSAHVFSQLFLEFEIQTSTFYSGDFGKMNEQPFRKN